jgi:hypothetical protein
MNSVSTGTRTWFYVDTEKQRRFHGTNERLISGAPVRSFFMIDVMKIFSGAPVRSFFMIDVMKIFLYDLLYEIDRLGQSIVFNEQMVTR